MHSIRPTLLFLGLSVALDLGCTSFRDCSAEDVSAAAVLPERLSETGLYSDIADQELAEATIAFTPRFPLWTDGTEKRRWLILPDEGQVDTSDPEDWGFPVGTSFFKEFARDGVRLETRMTRRTAEGWTAVTYVWSADGGDALRQLESVPDVAGSTHDVPSAGECLACHAGGRNFSLGFSATQLDPTTRSELFDAGVLSDPVSMDLDLPPTAEAGLGVLHGNCSHCHNSARNEQPLATDCYQPPEGDLFDLSLPADLASVDDAPAMLTARFLLGSEADSEIVHRMSQRNDSERRPSMPPLGTEVVDEEGLSAVEAFIATLPANER